MCEVAHTSLENRQGIGTPAPQLRLGNCDPRRHAQNEPVESQPAEGRDRPALARGAPSVRTYNPVVHPPCHINAYPAAAAALFAHGRQIWQATARSSKCMTARLSRAG